MTMTSLVRMEFQDVLMISIIIPGYGYIIG